MIENSIYEVSRAEYKNFIETIKPECRRVETVDKKEARYTATKTFSLKTGKCFASRVTYWQNSMGECEPEQYFIFELPEADESLPPVPKVQVILETKEQVQALFDGLKKMKEQEHNDGTL